MRVLFVSAYELGHQPVHVASPAGRLREAGHDVAALDLSVEDYDPQRVAWADAVAISAPMHTAMRLGLACARRIREEQPATPIAAYGVYAPVGSQHTLGSLVDTVYAGEYEHALRAWVDALAAGASPAQARSAGGELIQLGRGRDRFAVPARDLLPAPLTYARLVEGDDESVVGAVEASHGCKHRCRHCPLPAVYDGAFRVVDQASLLADVDQLVAAGIEHLTFADPDFLNGPRHALQLVEAIHARHPQLTFDATVKVEHILAHRDVWPQLAGRGMKFVISAVESLDDAILQLLDKGHTAADAGEAVHVLRQAGIEPRPTFLPFTPWSEVATLNRIVDWVLAHDLVGNVDPIQLTIRLLVPEGSLLADEPSFAAHIQRYDADALQWRWSHPDPAMDALQADLETRVARATEAGEAPEATFADLAGDIRRAAGRDAGDAAEIPTGSLGARPRMTEPWFC
jgi:radical SAM superfamily enzyme YgiQ (UPF0313 family)